MNESNASCVLPWFVETVVEPELMSSMAQAMILIEARLKIRFPKCKPMSKALLEYLAQPSSVHELTPNDYAMDHEQVCSGSEVQYVLKK
jgi:hypothetical protein